MGGANEPCNGNKQSSLYDDTVTYCYYVSFMSTPVLRLVWVKVFSLLNAVNVRYTFIARLDFKDARVFVTAILGQELKHFSYCYKCDVSN